MESPCYNKETKTDCPKRKAGCAVNCPDWDRYRQERDEVYRERQIKNDVEQTIIGSVNSTVTKIRKKNNGWHRKVFKDQ